MFFCPDDFAKKSSGRFLPNLKKIAKAALLVFPKERVFFAKKI
jgi:hypothetical protein